MRRLLLVFAILLTGGVRAPLAQAQEKPPDKAALAFFESKIRPVLVKECYSCHSVETKKGPKANLFLDSRDGILAGGDSGKVIVPGKPTESLLVKALHGDGVPEMPQKGKLPDAVIADFEKWVKMGAPDSRGNSPSSG